MKKLLITLAALMVASATAWAQGQIALDNLNIPGGGVPITGDTTGATAQLWLVGTGGALTPLAPTTTFRTSPAAATAYVVPAVVTLDGIKGGTSETFVLRAFKGASWDSATAQGQSNPFTVTLGGDALDGNPPATPAKMAGFQTFAIASVTTPEPSTIALAALGAAAFFIRRRK
jgi:hypothetical protein